MLYGGKQNFQKAAPLPNIILNGQQMHVLQQSHTGKVLSRSRSRGKVDVPTLEQLRSLQRMKKEQKVGKGTLSSRNNCY